MLHAVICTEALTRALTRNWWGSHLYLIGKVDNEIDLIAMVKAHNIKYDEDHTCHILFMPVSTHYSLETMFGWERDRDSWALYNKTIIREILEAANVDYGLFKQSGNSA